MSKSNQIKWSIPAGLACLALLIFASSASAVLTVSTSNQYGSANTYPFTPTWTPAADSLIQGLAPTATTGNFALDLTTRNVNSLTSGGSLAISTTAGDTGPDPIGNTTTSANYVTCGNGSSAGSSIIYTLPTSANGYNITNITVYNGWADNGRDGQAYTVLYSTKAHPGDFIYLASVSYNPTVPGSTPTANRSVISDSSGGLIAANVATVKFIMNFPESENGWVGYGAITVEGTAASSVIAPVVSITTSNQYGASPFTPTWIAETPSLIAGLSPSTATGSFAKESAGGTPVLTDGTIGTSGTIGGFATCGASGGTILIYTLAGNPVNGSDVTNIVTYSGWGDGGRDGQYYTVSYSTVSAPTTYIPITTVYYLPSFPSGAPANRVSIAMNDGSPLAGGVANIKFDFSSPAFASSFNNTYQGYSEIIVQGRDTAAPPPPPSPYLTQDTLPAYQETVAGDQIVFTAAFSNSPPANVQWLFISGGVTNVLAGQTSSTLTLDNVQMSDSGYYQIEAVNATNGAAAPSYSTPAQLVVNNVPAPVNGIVVEAAGQSGQGATGVSTNFYPTWTVNTENNLVLGFADGGPDTPGTVYAGTGNYGLGAESTGDPAALSDGTIGYLNYWPNVGSSPSLLSCGVSGSGAGTFVTYTLANSGNGLDITNITVYGGWGDSGRNEQKYQVLYSTMDNPTYFKSLTSVDYIPNNPGNPQSATRVTLVPSGLQGAALVKNVAEVKINFDVSSQPKSGWEGYSEIVIAGVPSLDNPILTEDTLPSYQETVVGDDVMFTAAFSNSPAANLQWQFIDTNNVVTDITGATGTTLILNNVQLTNSGLYRCEAVNASDSMAVIYSTPATLAVSNMPAAIGNVVVNFAGQCGLGGNSVNTNFYPNWTVNTNDDLIAGFTAYDVNTNSPIAPAGQSVFGIGNYTIDPNTGGLTNTGDLTVYSALSDGLAGPIVWWPGIGASPGMLAGGSGVAAPGSTMTYTLYTNAAPYGVDVTNITIYGGFSNGDRNEQKYQILYSTVAAPTNFSSIGTFDYNPHDPNNVQTATRVSLVPTNGVLAQSVYAVKINWALQGSPPKNGWEGYTEIIVKGKASPPKPILTQIITPLTADDVAGSSLTLTAGFSGATSYQWTKDGTNIIGAVSPTLTLSNLQLSDTATNGGYSLVASNAAGTTASRGCQLIVNPAPAAVGNTVVSFAHQTTDAGTFTPTWNTNSFVSSLIYQANPISFGAGNFSDPDVNVLSHNLAGGTNVLTDGGYGTLVTGGAHPAFATCGPSAGQFVVYALPASANGYDLTNIMMSSGWNDLGRDADWGTISYSTAANPTLFIPIAVITNNPQSPFYANGPTVIRATVTPSSGVLATHAAYVQVDFTTPGGIPHGYSGISQINVFGSPTANPDLGPVVTAANENLPTNTAPYFVVENNSLIENLLPSATGPGAYAGGFNNEPVCGGLPVLTDGTFGVADSSLSYATCGGAYGAGSSVTYTCTNGSWSITNIVVYSGWGNYDRDGQFYNVTYTTTTAPSTTVPLVSVYYNPPALTGPAANRVNIAPASGATYLATNVYSVTFDFTPQAFNLDNGYSGYAELVLQGTNMPSATTPTVPALASPYVSGGKLVLTGTGGTPNSPYTWLSTTNLSAPIIWTTNTSGTLDGAGAFSNAIPVSTTTPASYFRLRLP